MYVASLVLVELLQAALGISLLNRLRNYFFVWLFGRFIIDDAALYLSDKCSGSANIRSKFY